MPEILCPQCRSKLNMEPSGARCDGPVVHEYTKVADTLDLRVITHQGEWDAESFDQSFQAHDDGFEDGFKHALNAGIPLFVEQYRQASKDSIVCNRLMQSAPKYGLDIGCGCGWFSLELTERLPDCELLGVDISPYRIKLFEEELHKRGLEGRLVACLANGEYLPVADGEFDFVHMREVLEHVADPRLVMQSAYRVLRPEGVFIVTTPTRSMRRFWTAMAVLPALVKRFCKREMLFRESSAHFHDSPYATADLKKWFRETGFMIEKWDRAILLPHESYLQFIPEPIIRIWLQVAKLVECIGALRIFGLHHVIVARKSE